MEFLVELLLPLILYVVGIILIIVLIIIGIKSIKILDKVDLIVDSVEERITVFDGALRVIKAAADGVAGISDTIVSAVTSIISKILNNKKDNYKEDESYE